MKFKQHINGKTMNPKDKVNYKLKVFNQYQNSFYVHQADEHKPMQWREHTFGDISSSFKRYQKGKTSHIHVIARENKVHRSMNITTHIIREIPVGSPGNKFRALRQPVSTPGPLLGALIGLSSPRIVPRKLSGSRLFSFVLEMFN